MKIVIDEDIPFIKGVFEPYVDVVSYLQGQQISHKNVADADAMVVRTRTKCDEALLKGTKVRYIASATIGYDHIDAKWCDANGIKWSNAAGCNAKSVGQYVLAALLQVAVKKNIELAGKTIGIVGVGHVGSEVKCIADTLQLRALLNDPPREEAEGKGAFVSLDTIAAECDIITFHTPLIRNGILKTYHLANQSFLKKLKPNTIIINTSRGEVIDETALKSAISKGVIGGAVIDVWENEPNIDSQLLSLVDIATPHIAGYSTDGKAKATEMVVQAVSCFLNLPLKNWHVKSLPFIDNNIIGINFIYNTPQQLLEKIVPHSYDILYDDCSLRADCKNFEYFRKTYRTRREFPSYTLNFNNINDIGDELRRVLEHIGFNIN